MRSGMAVGWIGAAALGLVTGGSASAGSPTYAKDVSAILQKNCQDCHRPDRSRRSRC